MRDLEFRAHGSLLAALLVGKVALVAPDGVARTAAAAAAALLFVCAGVIYVRWFRGSRIVERNGVHRSGEDGPCG